MSDVCEGRGNAVFLPQKMKTEFFKHFNLFYLKSSDTNTVPITLVYVSHRENLLRFSIMLFTTLL